MLHIRCKLQCSTAVRVVTPWLVNIIHGQLTSIVLALKNESGHVTVKFIIPMDDSNAQLK